MAEDLAENIKVLEVLDSEGNVSMRLSKLNGVNHGPMQVYKEGTLIQEIEFRNGLKEGLSKAYNEHGELQAELLYAQGKLNGESRMYTNETLSAIMNYQDNELHGEMINYDAAGNRIFKADYKGGKLNGEMITYFDTGEPSRVAEYKNNRLNGFVTTFFPNGVRQDQKYYIDDKLEGRAITFDLNGDVREVSHYKDGLLLGPPTQFDEFGKILKAS